MIFETAIFKRRYKRFFADVELKKKTKKTEVFVAHVPNTGSLKSCLFEGQACALTASRDPARKTPYTLELTQNPEGTWIGVNTQRANQLFEESLKQGLWLQWAKKPYEREVKVSDHTRFDFQIDKEFVEVKNVTWVENGIGFFPDAVTERGTKHLKELTEFKQQGIDVSVCFIVQRADALEVRIAGELDPKFAEAAKNALAQGVHFYALKYEASPEFGLRALGTIPVKIES